MSALPPSKFFPPPESADPMGLIGFGGSLEPEWLLDAYRHGIFPWPMGDDRGPIPWFSLDPRGIFELGRMHISRRLRRTIRAGNFAATCDREFDQVIRQCGKGPGRRGATWLTPKMIRAYQDMHALGYAHSVEVWRDDRLAGGIYGIAIGGLFAAESMFYRVRDASKVALSMLMAHLVARGYRVFDVQQCTEHSASMGAIEIPRSEYLRRLAKALRAPVTFGDELEGNVEGLW